MERVVLRRAEEMAGRLRRRSESFSRKMTRDPCQAPYLEWHLSPTYYMTYLKWLDSILSKEKEKKKPKKKGEKKRGKKRKKIYIHTHVFIYIYINMHVCICMCMYIFICMHSCVCIYMYMYKYMYIYIYIYIHRHMHTFVQTHVRTCLYETKLCRNRYYCQKTWRTHKIGHKVCPRI